MRGLCIGFDIGGQARITSIRAWGAISAPSAFISALSGKYQVLLRTDCTTLERQEGTPKLLSITIVSAPPCTDCNRILRSPGFQNCRYAPAYPVAVKYQSDSTWTSGDFRLDIAAASAMLLPCSIPSRKSSEKYTNPDQDWALIRHELAHGKDAAQFTRTIASRGSDNPVLFNLRTEDGQRRSGELCVMERVPIEDVYPPAGGPPQLRHCLCVVYPKKSKQGCGGAACEEAYGWGGVRSSCAGVEGMILHSILWQCRNGASHRKNFDTPPLGGHCGETWARSRRTFLASDR